MPKGDCDWIAELSGVTNGSIHVVVVVGSVVRPGRSCVSHRVYVRNDALVIAEALDSGAVIVSTVV